MKWGKFFKKLLGGAAQVGGAVIGVPIPGPIPGVGPTPGVGVPTVDIRPDEDQPGAAPAPEISLSGLRTSIVGLALVGLGVFAHTTGLDLTLVGAIVLTGLGFLGAADGGPVRTVLAKRQKPYKLDKSYPGESEES